MGQPAAVEAAPVPIEVLFRPPYLSRPRLAPDGKSMAGLNHEPDGAINLALLDFGRPGATILKGSDKLKIHSFHWLNDQSLLVSSVRNRIYVDALSVVDRHDFRKIRPLSVNQNIFVLGRPIARPKNVILWRPRLERDLSNRIDLFEVSSDDALKFNEGFTDNVRIRIKYPEPGEKEGAVLGYDTDAAGELALCYVYRAGRIQALLFDAPGKKWSPLSFDAEVTSILAVEPDHRHIWISEYVDGNGFQVCRYSVADQTRGPAVITDPLFDPGEGNAYYSLVEGTLVGVSYEQRRLRNTWIHPRFVDLQKSVDRLLPHTDNSLVESDAAEKLFLYHARGPNSPGAYFLLDSAQGTFTPVSPARPWLAEVELAPTRPVKFTARDGLELEGYLTLPNNASAQNKVPLIVLCHGGPASRDTWSFDPEVQFLASRGYAVLQPNYRGSSGYRPSISKEWEFDYRRMHDDVTDAARTFRQLDLIDRDRIAIMGTSFGGYLAVAGAAFEGDLYRCAVTNSGVFNWARLVNAAKWNGSPGEYQYLQDKLGQPGKQRDEFARISPLSAVDSIRIPVFIAHGREDEVVDLEQSTKLASLLKRRKVPVETFYPDDEMHGFRSPENASKYYQMLEKFLARHLRGAAGK